MLSPAEQLFYCVNLERVVADLYLKMMKEEIRKQTEPPKPPVEMNPLENLLRPIAQEIAANSKVETNLQTIVDSLKSNYHVRNMQPFSMFSGPFKMICPEYYTLFGTLSHQFVLHH